MAKGKKNWIQGAIKRPGALRAKAARAGALKDGIETGWLAQKAAGGGTTGRQARMAKTLKGFRKRAKRATSSAPNPGYPGAPSVIARRARRAVRPVGQVTGASASPASGAGRGRPTMMTPERARGMSDAELDRRLKRGRTRYRGY